MTTKKTTKKVDKKKERRQDNRRQEGESFIGLAKDLKEIIIDLNQRVSEVESVVDRIRQRMGL